MFDPKLAKSLKKPERRSKVKKRIERRMKLSRAQAKEIVYTREKMRCQRCKRRVELDCWPWQDQRAHVNERLPRSLGGSPHEPENLELVCRRCHFGGPSGAHAPTKARMKKR
jgi:5-methylcytosine-specific restriction endonuclease McrA